MADEPKQHGPNPEPQPQAQPPQQQTPYEQQPVQQQYFAQPSAAPVQYVVTQQSLKGMRGWLLFFVIIAGLYALGTVGIFVDALANFSADKLADAIIAPFLFVGAVAAIVLTALEKIIAKYVFIGLFALAYIYGIIDNTITGIPAAQLVTSLIIGGLIVGLISLYFLTSKRIKETLVK